MRKISPLHQEEKAMLFRQLFDQESSTYTYLIADTQLMEAILVDSVIEQVKRDLQNSA